LDVHSRGIRDPVGRDNLFAIPHSVIEVEVANLSHVAWMKVQITPTIIYALGIGRPSSLMNSQRFEKRSPREIEGSHACSL
jgi:hypothetical protein